MAITFTYMSPGLMAAIEGSGHWLMNTDGVWGSDDDPAVQAIIDAFDAVGYERGQRQATLNAACSAAINAGFPSSALGEASTYTVTPTDQTNLISACTAAQAALAASKAWSANLTVNEFDVVFVSGHYYLAITGGSTGATEPATWPTAFQQEITDGSVIWALAGWLLGTASGNQWHTVQQVVQVYNTYLAFINKQRSIYTTLLGQLAAATSVADVDAIAWPAS